MTTDPLLIARWLAVALFFGVLLLLEVGRWMGLKRVARHGEAAQAGVGAVDGAVFSLLGLLVAFTFAGAASRFDTRRHLVVEEANAISTAYLRIDLLPASAQPTLRDSFRQYLDARLAVYRKLPDIEAVRAELGRATALQRDIWAQALAGCRSADSAPAACGLLIPALNQMINITTTRTAATQMHPPVVIFAMLVGLALASALLAGFGLAGSRTRNWLHTLGFALVIAIVLYVILDIEYPRLGFIRVDAIDQVLVELRASME
jgi:hypothetical protein